MKRIEKSLHIACFDSILRTCRLEARCILWVATDWLEGQRPRKRVKNTQNSAAQNQTENNMQSNKTHVSFEDRDKNLYKYFVSPTSFFGHITGDQ